MLEQIEAYPSQHLFLLKDLHPFLSDPRVVRKLRDMIPGLVADGKTLLLLGPVDEVPLELLKDVTVLELPLPTVDELRNELETVLQSDPELRRLEIDRAPGRSSRPGGPRTDRRRSPPGVRTSAAQLRNRRRQRLRGTGHREAADGAGIGPARVL